MSRIKKVCSLVREIFTLGVDPDDNDSHRFAVQQMRSIHCIERAEFESGNDAILALTYKDALEFADVLEKVTRQLATGVAKNENRSVCGKLDLVKAQLVKSQDEVAALRKELDFIKSEEFLTSVVARINGLQV